MISALAGRLPIRQPLFWWTSFAAWLVLLCFLSSRPAPDIEGPEIPHLDKVAHAVYFTLGGAFLGVAIGLKSHRRLRFVPWGLVAIVVIALIGALDEWHQTFTAARTGADFFDWMADVLGGVSGAILAARFLRRLPRLE